jgi:hypothetical protein
MQTLAKLPNSSPSAKTNKAAKINMENKKGTRESVRVPFWSDNFLD